MKDYRQILRQNLLTDILKEHPDLVEKLKNLSDLKEGALDVGVASGIGALTPDQLKRGGIIFKGLTKVGKVVSTIKDTVMRSVKGVADIGAKGVAANVSSAVGATVVSPTKAVVLYTHPIPRTIPNPRAAYVPRADWERIMYPSRYAPKGLLPAAASSSPIVRTGGGALSVIPAGTRAGLGGALQRAAGPALGAISSGAEEWSENSTNGVGNVENVSRTTIRAAGGGWGAWRGAALGAKYGSRLGPIGLVAGSVLGGIGGWLLGDKIGDVTGDVVVGGAKAIIPGSTPTQNEAPTESIGIPDSPIEPSTRLGIRKRKVVSQGIPVSIFDVN